MSARIMWRRGQRVEIEGHILRFDHHGTTGQHVFEDDEANVPVIYGARDIVRLVERRKIVTLPDVAPELAVAPRRRGTVEDLDDPLQRDTVVRRLAYLRAWNEGGDFRVVEDVLRPIIDRVRVEIPDPTPPSVKSVQRWIRLWRTEGRDPLALISHVEDRGRRQRRIRTELLLMIQDVIDDVWLDPREPSVVDAYKTLRCRVAERNEFLPPERRLPLPSISVLYRECAKIDLYTRTYFRKGKHVADRLYWPVGAGPVTKRHNECWEIDHTRIGLDDLPCIVTEDTTGLVLGEAWYTCCLDRHTRMITGDHVGFDAPSRSVVFECLRTAIMPKTWLHERYPDIEHEWPCFSAPAAIVADNGAEFRSPDFVLSCAMLGIDVQYTPVAKPWYKGRIERHFRTLCCEVFRRVPGREFAAYFRNHNKPPPEMVATVTLRELEMLIHKWHVDEYSVRKHRGLGTTPRQAWDDSVRVHGLPPPPDPARLDAALSLTEYRIPQKYGIEFEGLLYNSAELAAMRIQPGRPRDVTVKVDPLNLGSVQVLNPETNAFVRVPVVERHRRMAEGMTLYQHRLARALVRNDPARFVDDEGTARAHEYLRTFAERNANRGPRAARNRAARFVAAAGRQDERRVARRPQIGEPQPIGDVIDAAVRRPDGPPEPDMDARHADHGMDVGAGDGAPPPQAAPPPADVVIPLPADEDDVDLQEARRRLGIGRNLEE